MSSSSDGNAAIGGAAATGVGASSKTSNMAQEDNDNRAEEHLDLAMIEVALLCKRLQERCTKLERKAEREHARAQRIREQAQQVAGKAQQVAEKAKQVKDDAIEAEKSKKSITLQSILLRLRRNDANTIELNGRTLPSGYGEAIGKALRQNTMVAKLDLSFPRCLSSRSGIGSEDEMKPLLNFIAKNQLIDLAVHPEVELEHDTGLTTNIRNVSHELLKAISQCTRLERLSWCFPVAASTFSIAMANLRVLRDLEVRFMHSRFSEDEQRTIAASFQSATSLENLKLWVGDNEDLATRILSNMADSRPPLQELSVVDWANTDDNVSHALCRVLTSTSTIERFEMDDFELDEDSMRQVLAALQLQSVSKLSFRNSYSLEVGGLLASMLQTRTGGSDDAMVVNSSLRELHLSELNSQQRMGTRNVADSILAEKQVNGTGDGANDLGNAQSLPVYEYLPTIGSQLECLSLGCVDPSFFDTLRENADRVRLQRLELIGLSKAACVAFRKCIPYLTSIRSLKVAKVDSDGLVWVLYGLKNNGSICDVVTTDDGNETSDFSLSQLRLIDAYCQRNQLLNQLIESEPSPGDENVNDDRTKIGLGVGTTDGTNTSTVEEAEATTAHHGVDLVVRPPLLQAAQQVPNSRLTVVIRGLLALSESITKKRRQNPHRWIPVASST